MTASRGWVQHLFSLEIRKLLSYRVDFWLNFLGAVLTEMVIAYFLWKSIFESQAAGAKIGGYTFGAMLLYYLLIALSRRVIFAVENGVVSFEIYDGSLNRYLVYPVSLFGYKYVSWMANACIGYMQMLLSVAIFLALFGLPVDRQITLQGWILGSIALFAASSLYFFLTLIFEMVAFWAENVWSLGVMLRFTSGLLGGGLVPLSLFPNWSQTALRILPFHFLISFPVRCLMGEVGFSEWAIGMASVSLWCLALWALAGRVWRRGTLQYSGVGI